MVAVLREPLTSKQVRNKLYRHLFDWGDIQTGGWIAPHEGEGNTSGNKPDSRPPVPTIYTEITRAFTLLNTGTAGLERAWRIPYLLQHKFNRHQQVIWLFYVKGYGLAVHALPTEREIIAMAPRLPKPPKQHTAEGDQRVALELGLKAKTVEEYRHEAVFTMARTVRWELDD